MRFRAALLCGAFLAVVISATSALGQGFQGGLRGSIKDAGGVVPGVEVTLTNERTNISRSTVTNERGEYVFTNVDPGSYMLKAVLTGYKTIERKEIPIGTQQFITLDLTMEVGAIEENITVTGQSPIIDTSNASQGTVLDTAALQTLPSPGRSAFMIGTTVPTVIPTGDTQFNRQQDQTNASLLSLGGGTRRGNNYTLDGVPITDLRNRASANPTIEALDDMKVQVHTYDAEMGRTGGGVFNVTLKSGGNQYRGTAFFQTRPIWGQTNNFFSEKAGLAKPQSPYYLGGGAVGGPIVKNRTFFWFAAEMYHDVQTRNSSELMPTAAERAGDFSRTTNSAGAPVVIYDPLTHLPFPGNIIPANRINPVAAAMLKYLPTPDIDRDNGTTNYNRTSLIKNNFEREYTIKGEHKFTDKVSLTGFFLYNATDEPCANYFGTADQSDPNRFADPNDYLLVRRPKVLAVNNTWVLSDSSVMALRFGMTRFPDNNTLTLPFDPSTLGFASTFLNQITVKKFPQVRLRGYDNEGRTLGAIEPTQINWKSTSANGTYSRFIGTHTFKAGADFRKVGVDTFIPGNGAGFFDFEKDTTSSDGLTTSNTLNGNSVASFLVGFPSGNSSRQSQISLTTPLNIFTYYYGGYAQDDWRVSSNLTLNYGLRLEHEDGMHELNNNFTVGFDPNATNALSSVSIAGDPVAGTSARAVKGGLMYAGVDGNGTTQGNPPKVKWSPRVGAVYSLDTKTVIRGGYGIYWSPWNYATPSTSSSNYGQVGYTQNTVLLQTAPTPAVSLTNPFPNGLVQPLGNSLKTLTGVGTNIAYIDQNGTAPRVQQYSLDFQRELSGGQSVTISYVGARGDHLGLGGTSDTGVNINQLDPKYLGLGAALNTQLPNPFFGNANAGPFATSPTLSRGQLLRPYPQFGNVIANHVTEGKNRYNAVVAEWSKRATNGWGGRFSYTYSRLKDNQVGEGNFYSGPNGLSNVLNSYNYMSSMPACTTTNYAACYNPDVDYGVGLLDVPHRLILAPIVELPFGRGKRWGANSSAAEWIAGGWTLSAAINIQSGFPLQVTQADNTGLFGGLQRPNLVSGVPLATSGSFEDRLASADHPTATWWNPAAFAAAPAFTFGNAPSTITDLRSPVQANVDGVFIKNLRFGTQTAQIKIEMLNLMNRVNVRANRTTFGNSNFGQIGVQAGFMRITQVMFRYSF
jgi:trimeric autotransporter adhesin